MKMKKECLAHYCISLMGCRFQMLWGHTFVFGDIGLRRKNLKNLKTYKKIFKPRFFQPCSKRSVILKIVSLQDPAFTFTFTNL